MGTERERNFIKVRQQSWYIAITHCSSQMRNEHTFNSNSVFLINCELGGYKGNILLSMFLKFRSSACFGRQIELLTGEIKDSHFAGIANNLFETKEKGWSCWLFHLTFHLCRKPSRVGRGNLWVYQARSLCICWSAWKGKALLHFLWVGLASTNISWMLPSSSIITYCNCRESRKNMNVLLLVL